MIAAADNSAASTGESIVRTEIPPPKQRIFMRRTSSVRAISFAWRVVWATFCRRTPRRCNFWRVWVLRRFRARVPYGAFVSPAVRIEFPWNLRVGEGCRIMHGVIITCMGTVEIGERCLISQYAHICAGTHDYKRRDMFIRRCPISIGADTWIAADVFVGPDVNIGRNVVVGARSAVFSDLPDDIVAVGEPARKVKDNERHGAHA